MSENQRIIEKIIFSFKEEMSRIEHNVIKLRDLRARYGVSALNAIRQIWLHRLADCKQIENHAANHLTAAVSHY